MSRSNKPDWEIRRRKFWGQLVAALDTKSQLTASFNSPDYHYLYRNSVLPGANYAFIVSEEKTFARVEVYIGRDDPLQNDQIFDQLLSQRTQIEGAIGERLSWERLDHRKTARVAFKCGADFSTAEDRNQMIDFLSDMMVKFEKGFEGPLAAMSAKSIDHHSKDLKITMYNSDKPDWETRRRKFWGQLVAALDTKSQLTASFNSPDKHYLYRNSVLRGANYAFVVSEEKTFARVEVYIGRDDPLQNDQIFDQLLSQRTQIEGAIGERLSWERLDHRKTARVAFKCGADFSTAEDCNQMIDFLSDMMVKFENGFEGPLGGITI